jgi:hypothetical protein
MSVPITTALTHPARAKRYYSLDVTSWLRAGDTLSSCAVTVISGTATVATTPGGTGASTQAAGISGNIATTAVVSASPGLIILEWAVVSSSGETEPFETRLTVGV